VVYKVITTKAQRQKEEQLIIIFLVPSFLYGKRSFYHQDTKKKEEQLIFFFLVPSCLCGL